MITVPSAPELHEFLTRAVAEVIVKEDLQAALGSGARRLKVKQGFDPTRPNLHLGHVVCLRKLRTLATWGHEIVIVIGDYTTQIGDPTDKDETRPLVSHEQVLANAATYLDQFHRVVPRENTRVVYQAEWYSSFSLKDTFLLASRFSVQQMLAREEFRKRIAAKTAIPIKDMLYPLLQAYDSVAIEADVELGGTDQQFNLLVGRELQEQVGQRPQNLFILQLLEGTDGEKMSKSKPATGIWLTDAPAEIFGKVMSIADTLMPHYYEWGTELPLEEVRALLAAVALGDLHPREAKVRLAKQIVTDLHSAAAADEAAIEFDHRFREGAAPSDLADAVVSRDGAAALPILDLLLRSGLALSKGEARRLVEQGGVRVDGVRAELTTAVPTEGAPVLGVGKRRFLRIVWR
ncbi:MAG: tyrosine--tRNA ligase [Chloroflexi bacterium]|nr:tyrosine--tRNA ligase [Chloroflexota bacterium]